MKRFLALAGMTAVLSSSAIGQTIFFTGFNADGNDNLSFVALSSITSGTAISFSDNERSVSGWIDNSENGFTWTATSNIAAGTIVTLNNLGTSTKTSNLGTVSIIAGAGSNLGIGNENEAIWAFTGSYSAPTSFLAGIGNDSLSNTTNSFNPATYSLFVPGDEDVMAYIGPRHGLLAFADYLPYLTNAANWVTQDGSGDQSADGTAPDVPFSAEAFTVIPEPSTYAALIGGLAVVGTLAARRRFSSVA